MDTMNSTKKEVIFLYLLKKNSNGNYNGKNKKGRLIAGRACR